ncbi:hypothetical protein BJX68DRAFT_264727 [Aspergillus pseudodeflectus]|uniref:Uncharacterized protein n=1 Tax=Aspergillus pseudodeflectus TaxID=176178 RepID=A0ABR4KNX5_9EURO
MSTTHWGLPPPFSALDLDPGTPYSRVAAQMNDSGHLKWGFPIYRTTYEDGKLAAASDPLKCGQVPVTLLPAHWDLEEYDGRWVPEVDDDKEGYYQFPEIEGTTNPFVDWMLLEQAYITSVYDRLIVEDWYDVYVRPPRVYPDETDEVWKVI